MARNRKEYWAAYYQAHKAQHNASSKAYYQRNLDSQRACHRKRWHDNNELAIRKFRVELGYTRAEAVAELARIDAKRRACFKGETTTTTQDIGDYQ